MRRRTTAGDSILGPATAPVCCLVVVVMVVAAMIGWRLWFTVGEPVPGAHQSPAPTGTNAPVASPTIARTFTLDGVLRTTDGMETAVTSTIWLGTAHRPTPSFVTVPVWGSVTLTNPSDRPNTAVSAVRYHYWAGYPAASAACQGSITSSQPYCWHQLGTVDPFGVGPELELSGGESRTAGWQWHDLDLVSGAQPDQWISDLTEPEVIVMLTEPTRTDQPDFEASCISDDVVPVPPGGAPSEARQVVVVVAANKPVTCDDLP